jgi:glycosyltransferase involved in cell wall biosynthesis
MNIVHLTASPFFGGPERQMLGLARHLPAEFRSHFLSFAERGLCRPFLQQLRKHGFHAEELKHNAPHFRAAIREVAQKLCQLQADVLCCHGYKADLLGWLAARRLGVPIVAISRGWTWATLKVRIYEGLDRLSLHRMDRVVCVSDGQAAKVRRVGVPQARVRVIRNAIAGDRFGLPDPGRRRYLENLFPRLPKSIIGAAGRLSPEKGFGNLVEAAQRVVAANADVGFVIFGEGPLRDTLTGRIEALGLSDRVVLAGFRADLDCLLPSFDVIALPSDTEGLPNIVLEAFAGRVPVVATAVGGTPEVVEEGISGYLVPRRDPVRLAQRLLELAGDDKKRQRMGMAGYHRVRTRFTFESQSRQYQALFGELVGRPRLVEADEADTLAFPIGRARRAG